MKQGASKTRSAASLVRHLSSRLDDVVANQARLGQRLAQAEVAGFSAACADHALSSRPCRQADFGREHADWIRQLDDSFGIFRKQWEYTAICRALETAGMLQPGRRGLGFGVGREPLVAAFAVRGVEVVATDLPKDDARSLSWAATGQHALSLHAMRRPNVCADDVLEQRVTLRAVDMTDIPPDLAGFDFVWSACAFEHLGSIEAGLSFVEQAMNCLRPGGLAVHTTEFNVDSDEATVEECDTVAFRARDLKELERPLAGRGHAMAPFTVGERLGVLDDLVDVPPLQYRSLLLRLGAFRITSAIVVVEAGPDGPTDAPDGSADHTEGPIRPNPRDPAR
ncbi:MAG: hypothetical protein QOE57_16 [Acidimicrobiaceae bacterium]|nr:hypothetical protein [Acidimicrobiaceae bacterium]